MRRFRVVLAACIVALIFNVAASPAQAASAGPGPVDPEFWSQAPGSGALPGTADAAATQGTLVSDGLGLGQKLGLAGLIGFGAYSVWEALNQSDYHSVTMPSPSQGALKAYFVANPVMPVSGTFGMRISSVTSFGLYVFSEGVRVEWGTVVGQDTQLGNIRQYVVGLVVSPGSISGSCPASGNNPPPLCGAGWYGRFYTSPKDTNGGDCPVSTGGCLGLLGGARGQGSYSAGAYTQNQLIVTGVGSNWTNMTSGNTGPLSMSWVTGWDSQPVLASTKCDNPQDFSPVDGTNLNTCINEITYSGGGPVTGTASETVTCDPPFGSTGLSQQTVTASWDVSTANPVPATCGSLGANWTPRKVVITIPGKGSSEVDYPAATGNIVRVMPNVSGHIVTGVNLTTPNQVITAPAPDGTNTAPTTPPVTSTPPVAAPTPGETGCAAFQWSSNPLDWVGDAIKGAAIYLVVPCSLPTFGNGLHPQMDKWALPSPSNLWPGEGGCGGITVTLPHKYFKDYSTTYLNTCVAPYSTIRGWVYSLSMVGVLVYGVWTAYGLLASGLGVRQWDMGPDGSGQLGLW